jgi:uncharacterized protein YehS (DUF1456 family)
MTNNDILRRIRYTLDLGDDRMMAIFALADLQTSRAQVSDWLKKDDDPAFQALSDRRLAIFLNGLIIDRRGPNDRQGPDHENRLNNNLIFNKLKIAFDLKADSVLEIMELSGFHLSKHELSAFFRKPTHKNYRDCKDQVLRKFLQGLQIKYREDTDSAPVFEWKQNTL